MTDNKQQPYKIISIQVMRASNSTFDGVDFFFSHTGREPFTADEFKKGSKTREILEKIEDLIMELEDVF